MADTTTYTATNPVTGKVITKKSSRVITHVVYVKDSKGWGALNWCGSEAAAEKAAQKAVNMAYDPWLDAKVVPATKIN